MYLELNKDEHDLLKALFDSARADLKEEIYKTEDYDYKRQLGILQKVAEATSASSQARSGRGQRAFRRTLLVAPAGSRGLRPAACGR
jgi:hypothetical protein